MSADRKWIQTYTGKKFWPLSPKPEDVCIKDIAHSLSMLCRFNGHCTKFYSVAQHCCLVSMIAGNGQEARSLSARELAFHGLLHDAAEAYLGDIATPIKSREDNRREALVLRAILQAFGRDEPTEEQAATIKTIDMQMLRVEKNDLINGNDKWACLDNVSDIPFRVWPVSAQKAEKDFWTRFEWLLRTARKQGEQCPV